jgi:hypothetical protein
VGFDGQSSGDTTPGFHMSVGPSTGSGPGAGLGGGFGLPAIATRP